MSKIFKAFSWYSFDQAARRLSATTDSNITKEDIIRLVTEGRIPLYWYLHLKLCGIKAGFSGSNRPSIEERLEFSWKEASPLNGPMRISLETNPQVKTQLLSLLLSHKEKDRSYPIPVVVEDENGENWCVVEFRTQEEDDPVNMIGAGTDIMVICREPEYGALVLRKEDIEVFESSLLAEPQKRQSDMTKERNTLLKLVLGMAASKYGYSPEDIRSRSIPSIENDLTLLGEDFSISAATIRDYLREANMLYPIKR